MTPVEIDTSKEACMLTFVDSAGSKRTALLIEKFDAAHTKEDTESTRSNDDNSESSAGSNAEEGNRKLEMIKSEPSTSQEVHHDMVMP